MFFVLCLFDKIKTPTAFLRYALCQQSVFLCVLILSDEIRKKSVGQSFSALCASSLEYVSSVSSLHSLSEAVLLLSLTFLGLVSSKHRMHLLWIESEAFRLSAIKYAFTQ